MNAEQFADRLKASKTSTGWTACCPAHEDRTPSLAISEGSDGRVLIHDHAGCTTAKVLGALGLSERDLFNDNGNGTSRATGTLGEQVAAYDYADETGAVLFQVVRFYPPKSFRQRRPNGNGGWTWKLGDVRRVLYRLPELLQRNADSPVWIVEGEKDADTLAAHGLTATTNSGGGGKWKAEYGAALQDADVIIIPDNDAPGQAHGEDVARQLQGVASRVRIVTLPKGKDASEYLELGGTVADLLTLAAATPTWTPAAPASAASTCTATTVATVTVETADTFTDTGNATRLVGLHGPRLHYIAAWGKWLVWTPAQGRWSLDHRDVLVRELAKDVGRTMKMDAAEEPDPDKAKKMFAAALRTLDSHGITGMVDLARGIAGVLLEHEALDRDAWLLGVEHGVVDLHTGTLRPADPADLMTMQCPVRYDAEARAPRWQQAMVEWFPDPDVRAYVQRLAGSALVGAQLEHVFVIHYGGGRNGKGTFVRALQRVLGPYASGIHLSLLVESKYDQHDTVRASLFRTRLAVASETRHRVKLDEASVKNLSGGDRIHARRMREDLWGFDPTHSLWLQTNYLPEIAGRDVGIWSRIRVVKWETTFSDQQQDRTLDTTLAGEASGILAWLVEGCLAWQRDGLAEAEAVIRATLAYRQAEDTFTRFASETGLVFGRGLEMSAGELQRLLTEWAEAEGVEARRRDLGAWLSEHGAKARRTWETGEGGKRRQVRTWIGVALREAPPEEEGSLGL